MSSAVQKPGRFRRYAGWIDRRRWTILGLAAILAVGSAVLAAKLPLKTDLTQLLPPSEPSVRDLDNLSHRTRSLGTLLVVIKSPDPAHREAATRAMAARIKKLEPILVGTMTVDDGAARRFAWKHRFLFAPLADLEAARDGLKQRIHQAKLDNNPLYVSLDDEEDQAADAAQRAVTDKKMDKLQGRLHRAERKVHHPDELISPDKTLQLIILHAPFSSGDIAMSRRLIEELETDAAATRSEVGSDVQIGLADEIVTGVAEQRAVLNGMLLAILLTVSIVGLSLFVYFRSLRATLCLLWSLSVGALMTFAATRLTIGYLNSATAFLSAIVVGNGINFGIIVLARHLEERRAGRDHLDGLAAALSGSLTGTLTASLAAGVAYASLLVTDFRGFRDFGAIGGVGMVLCWLSAYTVLPAGIAVLDRSGRLPLGRPPALGRLLGRLAPKRTAPLVVVGAVVLAISGATTWRYLTGDPYEYNWEHLRADSAEAQRARNWMHQVDKAFGHGLASGFAIAVDRPEDAAPVLALLHAHAQPDTGEPPRPASADSVPSREGPLFRRISTIRDALPDKQGPKLAVLAELRKLTDRHTLDALSAKERADVERLRPPADLRPLTVNDIPEQLVPQFVEKDGSRGKLLYADQASRFNGWSGRHMLVFSDAVRELPFPPGTHLGGSAFIFADILRAVTRDGPRATLVALCGVVLLVVVLVGPNRFGLATVAASVAGTSGMLSLAWLFGIKVNFLDFVALPITLGISVDYAVNVVARERAEGWAGARRALSSTGGAVALCSWTTIVGYGSLLLSHNAGIRSFGLAAVLGEITCLVAALTLAPALVHLLAPRRARAEGVTAEHVPPG